MVCENMNSDWGTVSSSCRGRKRPTGHQQEGEDCHREVQRTSSARGQAGQVGALCLGIMEREGASD